MKEFRDRKKKMELLRQRYAEVQDMAREIAKTDVYSVAKARGVSARLVHSMAMRDVPEGFYLSPRDWQLLKKLGAPDTRGEA